MYQLLVKHPDVSQEKHAILTANKNSPHIKSLVREYKKQGFIVRWVDLSKMDILS